MKFINNILLCTFLLTLQPLCAMEEQNELPKLSRRQLSIHSTFVKLFKIIERDIPQNIPYRNEVIDIFEHCPFKYQPKTKQLFFKILKHPRNLYIKFFESPFFGAIKLSNFIESELKKNYDLLPELIHLANYMQFQVLLNALMILCITNNIDLDTTAFSESVVNTYIRFQYYLSLDHNQLFRHINIPGRPNTRSKKSKKPKSIQKILNIVSNKIRKRNNKIISAFPYHALTQDGIIQNPIPINPDIQNDSCYSDFSNSKNLQYLKHYTLLPKQAQLELTKSLKEITYQLLFDSNFDTFLENISDFALRQKMITHMIEWIEEYLDFTNDDEIKSFFKKLPEGLVKMALRFIYADKNNGTNIDTYRMNEIRNNLRQNKTEVDLGFCFNPTFGNLPDTFIMPIIEIAQPLYHVKNKSINLRSNHLTHIHSGLKNITHLKGLSLEANQIKKIHENFSKLIHLKQCNLINNSLKIFPPAICHLKSLEELKIRVKNLEIMPDNIKQMQSLKKLSLRCCGGRSLASEIGYLPALEELNISFSLDITQLPATIGNLSSLRVLNLECLSKVQSLPDEICKLSQLQKLGLKNCFRLTKLPDNIEALTNLQHLDIRDTKIPVDSIPEALRKQLGNNLLKD